MSKEEMRRYLDMVFSCCIGNGDLGGLKLTSFAYLTGIINFAEYKYLENALTFSVYSGR